MSDIKIQPSATGSGTVTITAPTTNTARVITLPDSAGTLLDENSSVPAANLTGTVVDARISAVTASKLTGALPAISAANLTGIPAANITGTLPAISGANLTGLTSAQMPAGSVLQVVNAANNVSRRTATTSFVSIFGTAASITPQISGSRIFASITIGGISRNSSDYNATTSFRIQDGSGNDLKILADHYHYRIQSADPGNIRANAHWFVDLGTSTTAGTAKSFNVVFRNGNGSVSVAVTYDSGDYTNITLWEIAQ